MVLDSDLPFPENTVLCDTVVVGVNGQAGELSNHGVAEGFPHGRGDGGLVNHVDFAVVTVASGAISGALEVLKSLPCVDVVGVAPFVATKLLVDLGVILISSHPKGSVNVGRTTPHAGGRVLELPSAKRSVALAKEVKPISRITGDSESLFEVRSESAVDIVQTSFQNKH